MRSYQRGEHAQMRQRFDLDLSLYVCVYVCVCVYVWWCLCCAPLRKWNFLRKPGVTKESQKQSSRPLKSSPEVLMLME